MTGKPRERKGKGKRKEVLPLAAPSQAGSDFRRLHSTLPISPYPEPYPLSPSSLSLPTYAHWRFPCTGFSCFAVSLRFLAGTAGVGECQLAFGAKICGCGEEPCMSGWRRFPSPSFVSGEKDFRNPAGPLLPSINIYHIGLTKDVYNA